MTRLRTGQELAPVALGPFTADAVARYAAAADDTNPVHTDEAAARAVGLPGRVVQSMLVMGHFEAALRGWWPDAAIVAMSARFARPLLVGDGVALGGRVAAREADGTAIVRLIARDGAGEIVMIGEARLALR